jgi:hypothetical protein
MSDVDDLLADEEEATQENAPISSRRPVLTEAAPADKIAQIAFGDESSPALHTPPPESGRLPAAPQPDLDYDADVTGVRDAPRTPPKEPDSFELIPEVTAPVLEASGPVADLVSVPPSFREDTFGDALDASLAL